MAKNNLPPFKSFPPKKGKGPTTPAPTPKNAAGLKAKTPTMGKLTPPASACKTCKKAPCTC